MSKVYYSKIDQNTPVSEIQTISRTLLDTIVKKENIVLESEIPLKVHFGEKGNVTYVKPENYNGIIDYLEQNNIQSCFIETGTLYGGHRYKKELHLKTAQEHGFTRLPIVIADGDFGDDFTEIEINKNIFKTCKIGREFNKYNQLLIIAHFKGHLMSGFGGAIKQLSMGCASKGGKLAMHMEEKPRIINRKCKKCKLCQTRCKENAITIGKKSYIDHDKCVGCGACTAICPSKAISIMTPGGMFNYVRLDRFRKKLVEYAYAAQKGKNNIYFNFAMNITSGCDCMPKKMKPLIDDFGVFVSTDPVAIDKACHDMAAQRGKKFRGISAFAYAEKIGLGSADYELIEV